MPMLHAVAHHISCAADDFADRPLVEQLAHHLRASAEEGVGRAAELETALVRVLHQLRGILGVQRQRLFRIGVLSGRED